VWASDVLLACGAWGFRSATGDPPVSPAARLIAGAAGSARLQIAAGKRPLGLSAFPLPVSPSVVAAAANIGRTLLGSDLLDAHQEHRNGIRREIGLNTRGA